MKHTEAFIHRRQLSWGDTDAARIVYTARVAHFAMEAIEAWFLDRVGPSFYDLAISGRIGTPFVRMELDFRSRMTPHDRLATTVLLDRIGRSSLTLKVLSHAEADERLCWTGRFVCVYTDTDSYKPIPVPERFREALEQELALGRRVSLGESEP